MENYVNSAPVDDGLDFQAIIKYLFVRVAKRWWVLLVCAAVFAGVGFGFTKFAVEPEYVASSSFMVDHIEKQEENDNKQTAANKDIEDAINYAYLMNNSSALFNTVAENSGYKITADEVKKMVEIRKADSTSIITLTVTCKDPDVAYAVARSYETSYDAVMGKLYDKARVTVVNNAVLPEKPSEETGTPVSAAVKGALIGFVLAVAVICVVAFFKDTIRVPDDIKNKLGSSVFGYVKIGKKQKNRLITDDKAGLVYSESFKLIRSKLENLAKTQNCKIILFTSPTEKEGKTTVTVNTALSLARSDKSVLLIDADFRKPEVYKELGVSALGETGLAGVISGGKPIGDSIKYFEKFNLFLLISGEGDPSAAEKLSSDAMAEAVKAIKAEFDYVIINTPPAELVADASVIARYADAALLVVRRDYLSLKRIKKTMNDLEGSGVSLAGCILNEADEGCFSKLAASRREKKSGYAAKA